MTDRESGDLFQSIGRSQYGASRVEEPFHFDLELYEDLCENAPDMIVFSDVASGTVIWCNRTFTKESGYSKEAMIGRTVLDLYHPGSVSLVREVLRRFSEDGEAEQHSGLLLQRRDGGSIDVSLKLTAVKASGRRVRYAMATLRNIGELKQAEALLIESESRFKIMADCAPVALWMSDTTALCTFFNQGWLNFTGRSMEEEVGTGWAEGVHPLDFQRCMDTYLDAFNTREEFRMEYRLRRYDGEYRWILDHGAPRYTATGDFAGFIGSCIDITDRKQAEELVKASLREKELLLREIHHRVKNNLQVISSLLRLQARKVGDDRVHEVFRESQNRIQVMALLHESLQKPDSPTEIDFGRYLRTVALGLFRSFGQDAQGIKLVMHIVDVSLGVDSAVLCGLIVNELISNSLKHAFPPGSDGEIRIELRYGEDRDYILTVGDNGIGLPGAESEAGRSLGLELVSLLAGQLGGVVDVLNGNGTTFRVTFSEREYKERY